MIIGHRGFAAGYPENTLASFKAAFKAGARMIEFDIQRSKEGIPVVIHDATLQRTTNAKGKVRNYSLSELQALDAGYRFQKSKKLFPFRGSGLSIPSFEDLLRTFPKKCLMVEIKDTHPDLTRKVAQLILKYKREKDSLMGSLDHRPALLLDKEFPGLPRFLSLKEVLWLHLQFKLKKIPQRTFKGKTASMPLRYRGLALDQKDWIDYLHTLGLKIFFWTVNDPKQARLLTRRGADGIITDDPKRLGTVLIT